MKGEGFHILLEFFGSLQAAAHLVEAICRGGHRRDEIAEPSHSFRAGSAKLHQCLDGSEHGDTGIEPIDLGSVHLVLAMHLAPNHAGLHTLEIVGFHV